MGGPVRGVTLTMQTVIYCCMDQRDEAGRCSFAHTVTTLSGTWHGATRWGTARLNGGICCTPDRFVSHSSNVKAVTPAEL